MISTIAEATMMYAWSPDWYHWFKLVVSVKQEKECQSSAAVAAFGFPA
jgi:hypothetical protein